MEKKTKKLQLRKETIAVLNGERMSHIIGGENGNGCQVDGVFYREGEAFFYGDDECVCLKGMIECQLFKSRVSCFLSKGVNCSVASCEATICIPIG